MTATTAPAPLSAPPKRAAATGLRVIQLRPRAAIALLVASLGGLLAFCWPLLIPQQANPDLAHAADAPWLFVALLPVLLAVVAAEVAEGGMDAKAIALLGVLAACGAAMRPLATGVTGFSFAFFLLIPAGRVLGRGFGFVLGTVTLFASALLTAGVGPWLPFQMLAAGWVGFFAGCLPKRVTGWAEVWLLAGYGAVAGLLYGLLLNLWFWPYVTVGTSTSFVPGAALGHNLARFFAFDIATSLGFDIPRAVGNAALVLVAGRPVLLALRRVSRRAAFDVPVEFAS